MWFVAWHSAPGQLEPEVGGLYLTYIRLTGLCAGCGKTGTGLGLGLLSLILQGFFLISTHLGL